MLTQRAVRRLLPDPVDDDIVLRCIELALKAPTGSNGQNWEFVVVKDADAKAALARPLPAGLDGLRRHRPPHGQGQRVDDQGPAGRRVAGRPLRGDPRPGRGLPPGLEGAAAADAADRRRLVLRLHLPERAEPAPGRPGHGPRGVADHPAAVEHHRRPAGPRPTHLGPARLRRPPRLAPGPLRPDHPHARSATSSTSTATGTSPSRTDSSCRTAGGRSHTRETCHTPSALWA